MLDTCVEIRAKLTLCIPQRQERIRDTMKMMENAYIEGSKRHKSLARADVDALKNFCDSSALDRADDLFKATQ